MRPGPVPGAEITLEANPETVSQESLAAYRQAGVNRISSAFRAHPTPSSPCWEGGIQRRRAALRCNGPKRLD